MFLSLYPGLAALAPILVNHDALVIIAVAFAGALLVTVSLTALVAIALVIAAHRNPAAHDRIHADVIGVMAALRATRSPMSPKESRRRGENERPAATNRHQPRSRQRRAR